MKVLILMGLPASGKTTFANELVESDKYKIKRIDFDQFLKKYKSGAIKYLSKLSNRFGGYITDTFIIDGLIHTNEQLINVINEVIKNKELREIKIHYWEENRAQCLINDVNRRNLSSTTSINNLPLELPNLEQLKSIFPNIEIINHQVIVKPDWLIFSDKYNLGCTINQPYLKSDSWCTGGSYGNCWNDSISYIDADEPLANFDKFDQFIASIKLDISFLTYKDIYNKTVTIGTSHESDYYGGSGSNYAYYQCNIELLYNELISQGLL